jgi:hypothetical protein
VGTVTDVTGDRPEDDWRPGCHDVDTGLVRHPRDHEPAPTLAQLAARNAERTRAARTMRAHQLLAAQRHRETGPTP